ncbi:hypothetical protein Plec18167_002928 [Paecilomyces lecythidis]|uniref:C3HC zinc finger domain protein n=1 Tax=Paecilomyces lecythidis TaxID=3004212 RepID=A0ABR3Y2L5_9EURO
MSYALVTKKRKFNRVLDSLSKPPSPDVAAKPTNDVPASITRTTTLPSIKKVRVSGSENDPLVIRTSVTNISRPSSSGSTTVRPNFVPWDRERFLERLETFRRVDKWSSKPSAVNEVEWAKRGWSCTDTERVSCVGGCGGSIVVKLPDELDELDGYDIEKVEERKEVRAKLVEEYQKLLSEGHGLTCPWRNKGCDATIHRLQLANPDAAISGLKTRYYNLVKMESKLPARERIEIPEDFNLEGTLRILPPEFYARKGNNEQSEARGSDSQDQEASKNIDSPKETAQDINRSAFALAFFGWDTVSDGTAGLAGCGACFRRLGLWMYKPKENGELTVYEKLNVVAEHMDYCPWVNKVTQSGSGKKTERIEDLHSGWEVLLQAIKTKHRRLVRSTGSEITKDIDTSSIDGMSHDGDSQRAKDKEWWSKLRRVRQALNVKAPKKSKPVLSSP